MHRRNSRMQPTRKATSVKRVIVPAIALAVLLMAVGCEQQYATSTSDTHVCVFDGSERGGQQLKFSVPPGAESEEIDGNDQKVSIPASNRFWYVGHDRGVADPGTPNWYNGNAAGGVPVTIEGQIGFRFNLELACDWFSRHGRRNANEDGDLGFNVRGDADQGWFRFLNQYFTATMQEVISEEMSTYKWPDLHYNYPDNADDAGQLPEGTEPGTPTRQILGDDLGEAFTERLRANLGDDYFCGIEDTPTAEDPCPPMHFQVVYAGPNRGEEVSSLVTARQQVEETRTRLESEALETQLQEQEQANQLAAEAQRQALLAEQIKTADLEAQRDTATCRIYASFGLDCEGHHAPVVPGD